jgi:hypothetical protein
MDRNEDDHFVFRHLFPQKEEADMETPRQAAWMPATELSQSIIKGVKNDFYCPKKYFVYEVLKTYPKEETESMVKGQLFEYLALGSVNREGNIPEMKRNKNGSLTADEQRIREQAQRFPELIDAHGIVLEQTNVRLSHVYSDQIVLTGIADALGTYQGKPYVFDLKLTGNIHSTWGEFGWGNYWNMDHTQAYMYPYILQQVLAREYGFMYLVFDYKPEPDYLFIDMEQEPLRKLELHESIRVAHEKLLYFRDTGYPPVGSFAECRSCKVEDCTSRVKVKPIEKFK